jgi:hypothetical protein
MLNGISTEYFSGEIKLNGIERMIYELSKGDLSKEVVLRKLPVKKVYSYYYLNRLNELNRLLAIISRLEETKSE